MRLELKFTGAAISGTLTSPGLAPGDITGGSYDARTRAVRFVVDVRGGGMTVEFAGQLARDSMAGQIKSSTVSGTFQLTRVPANAAAPPPATAAAIAMRAGLSDAFARVNDLVWAAIEMVPDDKLSFRPVATVRTFAQAVAHIADSYRYHCGRATRGGAVQPSDAIEKGPLDRSTLRQQLRFAIDICHGAAEDGDMSALVDNIAEANRQYGSLFIYLRLLGLTPPGS